MISDPVRSTGSGRQLGIVVCPLLTALLLLACGAGAASDGRTMPTGSKATLHPVVWEPVLTEFRIYGSASQPDLNTSWPAVFPFTSLEDKGNSKVTAWKKLRELVKYGATLDWPEDSPVIFGWSDWSEVTQEGIHQGLTVSRSDVPGNYDPGARFEVVTRTTGMRRTAIPYIEALKPFLQIGLLIYSTYPIPDPNDEDKTLPWVDNHYQREIMKKVKVNSFELEVYRLADFNNPRSKIIAAPDKKQMVTLSTPLRGEVHLSDLFTVSHDSTQPPVARFSLAKQKDWPIMPMKTGLYEIRLRMKLFLPEVDEQLDTWREKELEARIRYGSTATTKGFRVISDKLKKVDPSANR